MGTENKNQEYFGKFVNDKPIAISKVDASKLTMLATTTSNLSATNEFVMPKRESIIGSPNGWTRTCDETWNKFYKSYHDSIMAIKEIVPDKVYEYTFCDGDVQKTVCSESDQFSMEDSITIAYAKHFMGGTGMYNRAVDKAMKLFKNQKDAEEKAKKEKEDAEARRAKKAKKRAERLAKKREVELEEKIAIQAEAYRRAMESLKKDDKDA